MRVSNLVPDFMNFSSKKNRYTQNVDMCFHLFGTEKAVEIAIEIRFIFCEDKCIRGEGKKGKGKVQFASVLNVEVLVESIRKRNNYLIESLVTLFFYLRYICTAFFFFLRVLRNESLGF